jgi:hypothetical protein
MYYTYIRGIIYTIIHITDAPQPTPSSKIVQEFHKILYRVVQLCVHQNKKTGVERRGAG